MKKILRLLPLLLVCTGCDLNLPDQIGIASSPIVWKFYSLNELYES